MKARSGGLPTNLSLTLPLHTTRNYAQLLHCMLCAVYQLVGHQFTGAKAEHKMMVKLTPWVQTKSYLRDILVKCFAVLFYSKNRRFNNFVNAMLMIRAVEFYNVFELKE
jgi:hypothetical protein